MAKKLAELSLAPGWPGLLRALWAAQWGSTLSSKSQVQRFTLDTVSIQCPGPYLLLFSPSPISFRLSLTQGVTLMVGLLGTRQRGCCETLLGMASGRLTQVQIMVKSASCGCSQDCSSREKNENFNYFSCNRPPPLAWTDIENLPLEPMFYQNDH